MPVAFVSSAEDDRQILPGLFGLPEPWASSRVLPLRTFATARSVEFDALFLAGVPHPGTDAHGVGDATTGAPVLEGPDPRILLMVTEAYRHAKAVGGWTAQRSFSKPPVSGSTSRASSRTRAVQQSWKR
ncbi:hypothetical protein ACIQU4_17885 [Streptomyces sp. NPDC090741]|uniref:hypothetical protein n=1 Tax=Streptomyces sp. NPDC090741 TaxID=3365967 RepID=UPI00380310C5